MSENHGAIVGKTQKERGETDESLRSERNKTDREIAAARASVEQDADDVVQLARERADVVLQRARERTDKELTEQVASRAVREEIAQERSAEDATSSEERAAASRQLEKERESHETALQGLLRLEREDTDGKLLIERSRADHAIYTRDEFLGMVSHDLRSLLGGIAMSASLLAKDATAQGDSAAGTLLQADRIQRFTARMNRLIGDLLDVVSLEAGQLAVSPRPDDAVRLVRDAMESFQLSFSARGLTLTSGVAPGTLPAKFDHERILQVLANLLSNALKFTPEGGASRLTARRSRAGVSVARLHRAVRPPRSRRSAPPPDDARAHRSAVCRPQLAHDHRARLVLAQSSRGSPR